MIVNDLSFAVWKSIGEITGHFVSIAVTLDWITWALVLCLMFIAWEMRRWQIDKDDAFDFRNLFTDTATGKIDRFAFGYTVGLFFVAWFFVTWTTAGKMTEAYFLLCLAYFAVPKSLETFKR